MNITIELEPLASAGVQPEWLAPLIKEIWPARADEINALFTNGGSDIDPNTDHPYAIKLGDQYVGITGFYRYDDRAVGLCWHGVLPSVRSRGISRAAFDKVRMLAVERYPTACDVVELIPDDRATELVPYFSRLGFSHRGEVATFEYLPKSTTWRVYRAPLTVRGDSMEPTPGIDWIDCRDRKPRPPETPYKVYLVWVVQLREHAEGTKYLWQFSRDSNDWLPLPNGPTGAAQVVTHYSEVLDVLGSPPPKPHGPRGRDYM